jgi:hypothetical protein
VLTLAVVGVAASIAAHLSILAICASTVGGILPWAWAPSTTFRHGVFLALGGAALVGLSMVSFFFADNSEFGLFGIMRTAGAFALATAVVKYDLLGVPLPHIVVKRGVLAGAALAILFIVAQIGQNFLSAQYGLLGGGVIAGAFLFAASPIQKRMERIGEGKASPRSIGVAAQAEAAFRNAVALAYKDRRFTHKEELALADLAEQLGLGARRATEIRHELERTGAS